MVMFCHHTETPEETTKRVAMLEKVGEACAFQGSHHLAAKKFTQAGNKVKVCLHPSNVTLYNRGFFIHLCE